MADITSAGDPSLIPELHEIIRFLDQIDYPDPIPIAKIVREYMISHPKQVDETFQRLKNDEPYESIVGEAIFGGRKFFVNENVLIPRPESEILVEHALYDLSSIELPAPYPVICVDIGTGSGNLIITCADRFQEINTQLVNDDTGPFFLGLDISDKALDVALRNAESILMRDDLVSFTESDLLEEITFDPEAFIIILANLPYISAEDHKKLVPSVRDYEPDVALVGEDDGLGHYRRLVGQLNSLPNQWVAHFEMDPSQTTNFVAWIWLSGVSDISVETYKDQYDRARFLRVAKLN